LTWPISDSLNATVIVIVRVLTISANGELELPDDEEDDPRLPAVVPVLDEELDDEAPDATLEVVPADTESPGSKPESDTIVPLVGARNLVCASAVSALSTLSWALSTDAADDAELPPVEELSAELAPVEPPVVALELGLVDEVGAVLLGVVVVAGVVVVRVLGAVVVGVVVVGVVVVGVVVVVVGVVVGVVVVGVVGVVVVVAAARVAARVELAAAPDVGWKDTNSVASEFVVSRLAVDDEPVPELELLLDPSSAAARSSSAASSVSFAAVRLRVASTWPFRTCCPTFTYTCASVPLVWKLTSTSVPASTLPLPDTVDWTTPSCALTTSVEVRAELVGGPTSETASTTTRTATPASTYICHGRL